MPKAEDSQIEDSKFGTVVSWLFLLLLLALCWFWGWEIGATALADPDTCWLIAVGKWIVAHGIPRDDPFSWTAKTYAGQYLPYQWLAAVFFYQVCIICSGMGFKCLLFFVSYAVLLSFYIFPLYMARKLGTSLMLQAVLSVMAISAGSFHFPLRPELFSYLFISIMASYLVWVIFSNCSAPVESSESEPTPLSKKAANRPIALGKPAAFCAGLLLFLLWANLHSGFVLGLAIVIGLIICIAGASMSPPLGADRSNCLQALGLFLAGALLASLITPFQLRLYAYLPELFFSPMNKFNQELLPLSLHELLSSDYVPFLVLQIIFIASLVPLVKVILRHRVAGLYIPATVAFALMVAILLAASDLCRRMIPFAVLVSVSIFLGLVEGYH